MQLKTLAILLAIATSSAVFVACSQTTPSANLDGTDKDDDNDDDNDDDTRSGNTSPGKPSQPSNPQPSNPTDGGTDAQTTTPVSPEQTCKDTADAVAKAAQRCGESYQENYDAFVEAATGGGTCADVTKVRDEASLRGECFTYFSVVPCANLADPPPESCLNQLQ